MTKQFIFEFEDGSAKVTCDAATHTFKFAKDARAYSWDHTGAKLVLGQPPENKATDTYLPDPVL